MNRYSTSRGPSGTGVPRTRGDEPEVNAAEKRLEMCSPHARG